MVLKQKKNIKTKSDVSWIVVFIVLFCAIIAVCLFQSRGPETDYSNEHTNEQSNKPNTNEQTYSQGERIQGAKSLLEDFGYENVIITTYGEDNTNNVGLVSMNSLGTRNQQVWEGLGSVSFAYPDVSRYSIDILEPTRECYYDINGNTYRYWLKTKNSTYYTYIDEQINEQIKSPKSCA